MMKMFYSDHDCMILVQLLPSSRYTSFHEVLCDKYLYMWFTVDSNGNFGNGKFLGNRLV